MLTLSPSGSAAATIFTEDHQVVVTFRQGAIAFRAGEAFVRITLTPLDPMAVGPPPAGLRFDSNAYRIAAAYALSGSPASLGEPAVVVMRYASGATGLLQAQRAGWTPMAAGNVRGAMQLLAEVTALGTFAAAAPQDLPFVVQTPGWAYAIVVGVVLIPILYAWALLRPGSKSRRRR